MLTVFERSLIVRREIRFRSCESVLLKYIKCCLNASCMACLNLHGVVFSFTMGILSLRKLVIWFWKLLGESRQFNLRVDVFKVCSLLTKCE